MPRAAIALGSNLGDRARLLTEAVDHLAALPMTTVLKLSKFYETDPIGGPPGQQKYFNAAALIETALSPDELLTALLAIERDLGRDRSSGVRNAPRTVDLDLIFYDDAIIAKEGLHVPHPRMHERRFVLEPLNEVAPEWVHPELKKSVRELLNGVDGEQSGGWPT
ncbi:MAG TPA: 2-amino-4-hydroxy-6-hydroxymethyldihydropteridine diphosphokinase [Planctomycetota bacterium]|nr:2-amino-4-hydroxy-6-hydroxymethyldihydropteridine diphosphokinase [Planctomycetota bacterium]